MTFPEQIKGIIASPLSGRAVSSFLACPELLPLPPKEGDQRT